MAKKHWKIPVSDIGHCSLMRDPFLLRVRPVDLLARVEVLGTHQDVSSSVTVAWFVNTSSFTVCRWKGRVIDGDCDTEWTDYYGFAESIEPAIESAQRIAKGWEVEGNLFTIEVDIRVLERAYVLPVDLADYPGDLAIPVREIPHDAQFPGGETRESLVAEHKGVWTSARPASTDWRDIRSALLERRRTDGVIDYSEGP